MDEKIHETETEETQCDAPDTLYVNDENKDRGNWSGRFDFLLSMLGYSVGVGNVWRFSYLCYRNGGGVFLIPYLLTLAIVGIPMFYFEINIAQFSSLGTLHCWGFAPIFKGLGVGMVALTFLSTLYYNMLLSYSLVFLVSSFTSYLPWTDCHNDWNTAGCSHRLPLVNCSSLEGVVYDNATCYNDTSFLGLTNVTVFENSTGILRFSPSEEYFNHQVLGISSGLEHFGHLQWKLVVGLFVGWVIVFLCIMKGIKTSGKVVYVTATFPYLILTILLGRGLMLEGAYDGVLYYITPKWEKLAEGCIIIAHNDTQVWRDGVTQIFYSMGMGWGSLQALASYNKFHNNSLRDAVVSSVGACLTSIYAGFVVFAFLGAMSHSLHVDIDQVVTSGPGLAFVVYPEAFTYMPCPSLWSVLFFLMIIALGLDTQFVMFETVVTCILDQLPSLRPKKTATILCLCIFEFLCGLPFTSAAGMYIFQLIDNFLAWVALPIILLLEAVAFGYVYGTFMYFYMFNDPDNNITRIAASGGMERFSNDIRIMTGRPPPLYFKVCLRVLLPILIPFVLIYPFFDYTRLSYGRNYLYPVWGEALGWIIAILPLFLVAAVTVHIIVQTKGGTLTQKWKTLLRPTPGWGPHLPEHRRLVDYVPGFIIDVDREKIPLVSL